MATEIPLGADAGRELTLADWMGKGDTVTTPVERIRRFLDAWSGESGSYFVARAPGPDGVVVLRLTDLEAVVQTLELLRQVGAQ